MAHAYDSLLVIAALSACPYLLTHASCLMDMAAFSLYIIGIIYEMSYLTTSDSESVRKYNDSTSQCTQISIRIDDDL